MGGSLSKRSITAIKWLLTDNKISSRVFEDADNKEKYKICTVRNDGKIILGKTPYYWWNQLIKCQDTITFQDFAFRCWDALVDMAGPNSTVVYEGLRNEIAEKAIRKDQYDWVVDRLFDVARHVCTEGSLSTVTDLRGDLRETKEPNVNKAYSGNTNKVININVNGERKSIPITDSVGDPLIDIIVGPIGFKVRNGK